MAEENTLSEGTHESAATREPLVFQSAELDVRAAVDARLSATEQAIQNFLRDTKKPDAAEEDEGARVYLGHEYKTAAAAERERKIGEANKIYSQKMKEIRTLFDDDAVRKAIASAYAEFGERADRARARRGGKKSRRKRTKKSRTTGGKKSRKQRKRTTLKGGKRKRRRTRRRR